MELLDWAAVAIIVYVVVTFSLRSLVLLAYAWLIREFWINLWVTFGWPIFYHEYYYHTIIATTIIEANAEFPARMCLA